MRDPFAPKKALRLKPVDVAEYPAPLDLRRSTDEDDSLATLTVGRDTDNDVALSGGRYPSVSSHHARFELRGDSLYVVDLDSRNGVLVGGEVIVGERRLDLGDQVRLGSVGPKFLVVGARALEETVFVRRESLRRPGADEALRRVERGNRRTRRLVLLLGFVIVGAIGFALWDKSEQRESQQSRDLAYEEELRGAAEQIAALEEREAERIAASADAEARRASEIARLEASLARRTAELEATLQSRSDQEQALITRIAELETTGASREVVEKVQRDLEAARGELGKTRDELASARRRVDLFDPVNLAQARLSGVGRVRSSVVLIENRATIVDRLRGESLHLEEIGEGPTRSIRPNYDGLGEEFGVDSTGSGFCVHPDGWILTNAHVVSAPDTKLLRDLSRPAEIEREVTLQVV
ncbi:MAG: FHA domain-containing protein, partial [Planctomycetota bacterium]